MRYQPMLLTKTAELPQGEDWVYEAKLDGYRMIGEVVLGQTRLTTRKGNDFTDRYPQVADQLPVAFGGQDVVCDGELVGFNESGQEDFAELRRKHPRVIYFIFDLLEIDSRPLINVPLRERRHALEEVFSPQGSIHLSHVFSDREGIVAAAKQLDLEGVVAKRLSSVYRPGKRSKDWLKLILKDHPERGRWDR